jgi:hypothetical protein
MIRRQTRAVAGLLLLVLLGCSHNPPATTDPTRNLSAQGKAAYEALKIGKALDVLRDVAVAAERQNPKLLSSASALKVISYHRQVALTMGAVPDGWIAVALTGLEQLTRDLSPAERAQLAPFVELLKTLYAAFVPGGGPMPDLSGAIVFDEYLLAGGL